MLLCGFEKFNKFYVRIDILERLFIIIFNSNKNRIKNTKEIKLIPEMLNLLGCNKENFKELLKYMNYKTFVKEKDIYFKYIPFKKKTDKQKKFSKTDSPFSKLVQLNIK